MKLMKQILSATLLTALFAAAPSVSHAQLLNPQTILQSANAVENEVAAAIKQVRSAQEAFRISKGRYAVSLEELGVRQSLILREWGVLSVDNASGSFYTGRFVFSRVARIRGIRTSDVFFNHLTAQGLPRYQSLADAREEIRALLLDLNARQKERIKQRGGPELHLQGLIASPLMSDLLRTGQLRMEVSRPVIDPATGRMQWRWTIRYTPGEIARMTDLAPSAIGGFVSTVGMLNGQALRIGMDQKACVDPVMVNILGVTNHVYTIDQSDSIQLSSLVPLCNFF